MKKKWHVEVFFAWFDLWVGAYYNTNTKNLYICLLPMIAIRIWFTEHILCGCGGLMGKEAHDTGDGWLLGWYCENCEDYDESNVIDWPFKEPMSAKDLRKAGYKVF